jgi:starch synthase
MWKRLSDPGYRDSLTKLIQANLTQSDYSCDFLQLGSLYNVARMVRRNSTSSCYSYNDGNLAVALRSPYFPSGISETQIDKTLAYEREVSAGLEMVFTMSEYLRQSFIKDLGVAPERVVCIGAGINLDLPAVVKDKDYSKRSVLFVGIDFARKGCYDVLKAFRIVRERLPNARLHIVGPAKMPAGISEAAGVVWHGFLDKNNERDTETLASLFEEATLFVMPSLYEPFGIAPLEAMAHRIPCVTSNAWAFPEIVPDRSCGRLVRPGDHEQLAEVMFELLRDPALLKRYGEAGRKHVAERYTWTKVVERLCAVLAKARTAEAC